MSTHLLNLPEDNLDTIVLCISEYFRAVDSLRSLKCLAETCTVLHRAINKHLEENPEALSGRVADNIDEIIETLDGSAQSFNERIELLRNYCCANGRRCFIIILVSMAIGSGLSLVACERMLHINLDQCFWNSSDVFSSESPPGAMFIVFPSPFIGISLFLLGLIIVKLSTDLTQHAYNVENNQERPYALCCFGIFKKRTLKELTILQGFRKHFHRDRTMPLLEDAGIVSSPENESGIV